QKLLADSDFASVAQSQFEAPSGFNVELDCDNVRRQEQSGPYRQREY
ncbi:MAG: hypothetical protein IH592_15565, partial [Bacteroidales bacterium]|nr:hypothetical protein [Bacteroidales bacterium]